MQVWSLSQAVQFLEHLVNINSGTLNTAGVEEVLGQVGQQLRDLGFDVQMIGNARAPEQAPLLLAELKGEDPSVGVTLLNHADTVFEGDSGFLIFERSRDGKQATGPGVIDDKGGIVVALWGLQKYLHHLNSTGQMRPPRTLRWITSPCEEVGSPGWTEQFKKWGAETDLVLDFEPAVGAGGDIVRARKGNRWYRIEVQGREAHAGRAHAEGVNAARELAIKIGELESLTDYDRELTVNVGSVTAGSGKYNVVCGHAEARVDTRFRSIQDRDQLHEAVQKIVRKTHTVSHVGGVSASTRSEIVTDCPPLAEQPGFEKWVDRYVDAIRKSEGRTVQSVQSGGASDANFFAQPGLTVLDGLGPVGGEIHSNREWIEIASLETRAQALAGFLGDLGR